MAVMAVANACDRGLEAVPRIAPGGDAGRGRKLIQDFSCGACHRIPGVRGARGLVGPPLDLFAHRTFIGGQVPNTPQNLVRWVMDPHQVERGTAMPALGLDEQQARDVAAYLYTLR
jgi:cytochrome c2